MDTVKLIIDNREVEVPKGTTILKAAQKLGIDIPTLCHFELENLHVHNRPGGCRICVVEVEKRRNLAPACVTECMEGMVVKTNSIRVINARKTVLELILSDHPADCLQCAKSGRCELQDLAVRFGVRENPYIPCSCPASPSPDARCKTDRPACIPPRAASCPRRRRRRHSRPGGESSPSGRAPGFPFR